MLLGRNRSFVALRSTKSGFAKFRSSPCPNHFHGCTAEQCRNSTTNTTNCTQPTFYWVTCNPSVHGLHTRNQRLAPVYLPLRHSAVLMRGLHPSSQSDHIEGDPISKDFLQAPPSAKLTPHAPEQPGGKRQLERSSSFFWRLKRRSWFKKSNKENGLAHLPTKSQGKISPCSSTDSTQQAPPATAQLQPAPSGGADVCDGEINISSCCVSRCTSTITAQKQQAGTTCSCSTGGPSCSAPLSSSAPGKIPSAQQLPVRRRTTGSVLAMRAQLRQFSRAVLRPARTPAGQFDAGPSLAWPAGKGSKAHHQRNTSLPPLSWNSKYNPQKRPQRAASLFEATGKENIRYLLGPHAIWGSVTRYKRLLLAEQLHEAHLQTVLSQTVEQVDWAGTPAWEEDFSVISRTYGERVRQTLFWWGGALAHLRWKDAEEDPCCVDEPAAQVSVILPLDGHADADDGPAGSKKDH